MLTSTPDFQKDFYRLQRAKEQGREREKLAISQGLHKMDLRNTKFYYPSGGPGIGLQPSKTPVAEE